MNKSIPNWVGMQEILNANDLDWVMENYDLTIEEIQNIMYGGSMPTEESDEKLKESVYRADLGKGKDRMLRAYLEDHFEWDNENQLIKRCRNAKDKHEQEYFTLLSSSLGKMVIPKGKFLNHWIKMYLSLTEWDMKIHENGMKPHGWVMGERVINQTTSKTTDDNIHDRMERALIKGELHSEKSFKDFIEKSSMTDEFKKIHINIDEYEGSYINDTE